MTLSIALNFNASAAPAGQAQAQAQNPSTKPQSAAIEQALQGIFMLLQQMMNAQAGGSTGDAQPSALPPSLPSTGAFPTSATPTNAPGASGVPGAPNTPPQRGDKPTDPTQGVDDYLDANHGLLRKLGNQEGVQDKLKARYGDWTDTTRSPADRAQSAYNASRHVGAIKHKNGADGKPRGDAITNNGKLDGATHDGDIRDGTELGDLKNSLKGDPATQDQNTAQVLGNPNLKKTSDSHVRADGTTKDNFQWAAGRVAKALWFVPIVNKVLGGVGDSRGGFGGVLKGAITGAATMYKDDIVGLMAGLKKGKMNPFAMAAYMGAANIKDSKDAPAFAKKAADKLM